MRKYINLLLVGLLAFSMVGSASAQSTTGNAQVKVDPNGQGSRSVVITQAPDFGTVPYSFDNQTASPTAPAGNLVIVATVNTGDNLGWNVTLSGTNFNGTAFPVGNMTLGTGAVTASPGTVGNITTTSGAVTTAASKVISATATYSSNGKYTVTYSGNSLVVPGNTLVGTYTSTLTVAISSAP